MKCHVVLLVAIVVALCLVGVLGDREDHRDKEDHKDGKDLGDGKDHKDGKDLGDGKDREDGKDHRDRDDHNDGKDLGDGKDHKDGKDQRDRGGRPTFAGAPQKTDVEDEQVKKYAPDAINALKEKLNSKKCYRPEIVDAERQIVAGFVINYQIDFHPTECTDCDEKTDEEIQKCPEDESSDIMNCHASVYVRPWEHYKEVNKLRCSPA